MKKHKIRLLKNIFSSIIVVLIFLFSFIALINFSFHKFYIKTPVKGYSMRPTINMNVTNPSEDGDIIYINPYTSINLNDIVVAKVSWHTDLIIKRVVGTPGDKIEIKDLGDSYGIFTNDKLLYNKEKYGQVTHFPKTGSYAYYELYQNFITNSKFEKWIETENNSSYIRLGEDEYFILGDNWGQTTDCLSNGPIKLKNIIGVVDYIIDVSNDDIFAEFKFFLKKLFSFN